jgi:hypothetical protein
MGLVSLTAHTAGTILTAAALNNNDNAIINQLNGNIEAVNLANLCVTTAKINTNAVTAAKLDNNLIDDLTLVTGASTDHLMIADASDSGNLKRALASDFQSVAASSAEVTTGTEAAKYVAPSTVIAHHGVVKGWVAFDGTGTPTILDSFNADASITDNGTGDWTVSWTTDFGNDDYCAQVCHGDPGGSISEEDSSMSIMTIAVGSIRVRGYANGVGLRDFNYVSILAIGDR